MPIDLVRIDDRLIHAQIILGWVPIVKPDCIIAANDDAAKDPFRKKVLTDAGYELSQGQVTPKVLTLDSCLAVIREDPHKRYLISLASPTDALYLVRNETDIKEVSLGWMSYTTGKRKLLPTVYVSDGEMLALKELLSLGITVSYQASLSDERKDLKELLLYI